MYYFIISFLKIVNVLKKSVCINCKYCVEGIVTKQCSKNHKNYGNYVDNYDIGMVLCEHCNPNGNCGKFKK